ncbi:MAG TPA: RNA chaperone Hfq [Treponemataceae bacterium]|nr:RNA chaperone Hfq [Treponemataceae bacterium]
MREERACCFNSGALYSVSLFLQDVFLNQVRKEHIGVTIYLTNGFQLKGLVKGFDNFTVVLDTDGKQQLVYKHAISTVTPYKAMNLIFSDGKDMNI